MITDGTSTIQRAWQTAARILCALAVANFLSLRAESSILPLPGEQDSWSDMAFPSITSGGYTAGSKTLAFTTGANGDLEIGSEFGPSNPGRHYGNGGTLGGPFSATLTVSGVIVEPNGTVSNGGTVLVTFNGGSAGSVGTDYGISAGATLLQGTVLEVLLGGSGINTLDVLYSISGGALQTDNPDPNVGVYAPNNLGLLRIAASSIPSNWSGDFGFVNPTIDAFGLVPEPTAFTLICLAGLFVSLTRWRRKR